MKKVLVFSTVSLLFLCCAESMDDDFLNFQHRHHKKYKNIEEERTRRDHFKKNHKRIGELNLAATTAGHNVSFRANKFADKSWAEFHRRLSKIQPANQEHLPVYKSKNSRSGGRVKRDALPEHFDLRDVLVNGHSIVGEVKNQEECGCCWAFAATAITETANALFSKNYRRLSDHEICDCADTEGTPGCVGGDPRNGLQFVYQHGQTSDDVYPYEEWRANTTGNCAFRRKPMVIEPGTARVYRFEERYAEEDIMENLYLNHMPSAVYFKVGEKFEWYDSGILQSEDCESSAPAVWHSAAIIGYGSDHNVDYWIVRNSWDSDWGEDGYVRVKRGVDWCEIETHPATVAMGSDNDSSSSEEEN